MLMNMFLALKSSLVQQTVHNYTLLMEHTLLSSHHFRGDSVHFLQLEPVNALVFFSFHKVPANTEWRVTSAHGRKVTSSRQITEVRQRRARLVLGWVTAAPVTLPAMCRGVGQASHITPPLSIQQ